MKVVFEHGFAKELQKLRDNRLLAKIREIILECKEADSLTEIRNLKKLQGYDTFYRIRVGDYRIGIEFSANELVFTRILHRKEIYKYFP
ncbi:MAG: type II toxin-antitoxin system RelE/ParE family toxin [Chlorobiaceae bacterium]|nr:type II toxin-antitoxin system RelE/ParE family toxin [Chlorobiaceae bacterium]